MSINSRIEQPVGQLPTMDVCGFYRDKTVLITGATGFLGQVLVEKLLRSVPGLKKIVIIVRDKNGATAVERIRDYFESPIFARLKYENADYKNKVAGIVGSITDEDLGLDEESTEKILDSVNVVFHAAATVDFTESLKAAVNINVKATYQVLKLSKRIKRLESFVYVSTAYSNCILKNIGENIYCHTIKAQGLMTLTQTLSDEQLLKITPTILDNWPNTYTYTKNISENLINDFDCDFPIGVLRPSIIISTAKEPFPGWITRGLGPYKYFAGIAAGILRTLWVDAACESNVVHADMVVNCLIAVAADVAAQSKQSVKVYNYTSHDNPLSWGKFIGYSIEQFGRIPTDRMVWYPIFLHVSGYWNWRILNVLCHNIPSVFLKIMALAQEKNYDFNKIYNQIHTLFEGAGYFSTQNWSYDSKNVRTLWQDLSSESRKTFPFDMKSINWKYTLRHNAKGIKLYLLREKITKQGLKTGRRKYKLFQVLHEMLKISSVILGINVALFCFKKLALLFQP